ncbi:MAG: hypothetical protein RIE08_04445 [Acidimicrobiales bacterium]
MTTSDSDASAVWPDHELVTSSEDGRSVIAGVQQPLMRSTDFAPPAEPFLVSEPIDVDRMFFFEVPVGWAGDWHPSPRAQYYVQLRGSLRVEFGSGESRLISPGELMRLEDVTGEGHRSSVVGDEPARGLFVQLRQPADP